MYIYIYIYIYIYVYIYTDICTSAHHNTFERLYATYTHAYKRLSACTHVYSLYRFLFDFNIKPSFLLSKLNNVLALKFCTMMHIVYCK